MSTINRDILLRVQEDCFSRILAHPYCSTAAVVMERKAFTEAEVQKLLQTVKGRSGKVGLAILVQRPVFTPTGEDFSVRGQVVQAFTVLEHPTLNAGDIGTGISSEEMALELIMLFHGVAATLPLQVFTARQGGAVLPDDAFGNLNAWEAGIETRVAVGAADRCAAPLIEPEEGAAPQEVTLTCGTPGAAIYYTLDGSYPSSANPAAILYSAPVAIAAAGKLRAAAEKAGLQQSSVCVGIFS